MNSLYDRDDARDSRSSNEPEREISLGTSTILGIFFALALICAVFFGFGYTMGRRSAQPLASTSEEPATTASLNTAKPTPASTLSTPSQQPADATDTGSDTAPGPTTAVIPITQPDTPSVKAPSQPIAKPVSLARATPPPAIAAPGAGAAIVQVAAVSHKEDADLLLAALRKRGYTAAIHQESQDKLLHVQLGPFASKKDADTMRQRLLTDGYNAIVK